MFQRLPKEIMKKFLFKIDFEGDVKMQVQYVLDRIKVPIWIIAEQKGQTIGNYNEWSPKFDLDKEIQKERFNGTFEDGVRKGGLLVQWYKRLVMYNEHQLCEPVTFMDEVWETLNHVAYAFEKGSVYDPLKWSHPTVADVDTDVYDFEEIF